jgi:hypothetical protein
VQSVLIVGRFSLVIYAKVDRSVKIHYFSKKNVFALLGIKSKALYTLPLSYISPGWLLPHALPASSSQVLGLHPGMHHHAWLTISLFS